jgi:hypothetical protein
MNTPVTLRASMLLRHSLIIEELELRLSIEESVLKLDASVAAVAKWHVVGGPATAKRYAVPYLIGFPILRFNCYSAAHPQRPTTA